MAHGFTHSTPQAVGDQLEAQEMSATSPSTELGSLTPISNLPVELLQLIFSIVPNLKTLPLDYTTPVPLG